MNITFNKKFFAGFALAVISIFGAWTSFDAASLSFHPSTIIAHADDAIGCDGCSGYGYDTSGSYSYDPSSYGDYSNPTGGYSYPSYDTTSSTYDPSSNYYGNAGYNYDNTGYSYGSGGSSSDYTLTDYTDYSSGYSSTPSYSDYSNYSYAAPYTYSSTYYAPTYTYTTPTYTPQHQTYPQPTCQLSASQTSLSQPSNVTISWTSTNATSGSIDNGIGSVGGASGTGTMYIAHTTTFNGTFYGSGGSVNCSVTVQVQPAQAPTCQLSASQTSLSQPGNITISWTSNNATSGSIDHGIGTVNAGSGSQSVYVSQTTTFNGLFTNTAGQTVNCGVTVVVQQIQNQVPSCSITSSGNSYGGSATLSWTSNNATSGYIDQGVGNVAVPSGSTSVSSSYSGRIYTLTVNGPGGTATCQTQVYVNVQTPSCSLSTGQNGYGSTTLYWTTNNAVSAYVDQGVGSVYPVQSGSTSVTSYNNNSYRIYTMTVYGPNGNTATCQTNVNVVPVAPTCALYLSQNTITLGQVSTLSWTSANATSAVIDNGVGNVYPTQSGSTTISPSFSRTYTGTFTGPNGTVTCSVPITVINSGVIVRNDQPLGAVYLSQVPYTGFAAGPALTVLFWLSIGIASALAAYFIVGKESLRLAIVLFSSLLGFQTKKALEVQQHEQDRESMYGIDYPAVEPKSDYTELQDMLYVPPPQEGELVSPQQVPIPVPTAETQTPYALPALSDVMESRAHAAGVLLSPEVLKNALELSTDRAEGLRMFGEILNQAVRTVAREDGWVMLNADRFDVIRREVLQGRGGNTAGASSMTAGLPA